MSTFSTLSFPLRPRFPFSRAAAHPKRSYPRIILATNMSAKLFKDGYKLNLCYITDRIAVMGNFYENDTLNELRRFLGCKHHNHHTIYNVSSEAEYNIEQDLENVRTFPINASNPCAIRTLLTLCGDVDAYINNNSSNVVIFHCKTGN